MAKLFQVVFVLGGPGSGKGTQSSLIQQHFKFLHLSAGQLLRNEQQRPSSKYGPTIKQVIESGKIVPSHITINLLKEQMQKRRNESLNFLIDGFPRNLENYHSWQQIMTQHVNTPFMLHLTCTEEEMLSRLELRSKSQSRSDDTPQIIRKRFKTYRQETLSVIAQFQKAGKVRTINADKDIQEIFEQITPIFQNFLSTTQTQ